MNNQICRCNCITKVKYKDKEKKIKCIVSLYRDKLVLEGKFKDENGNKIKEKTYSLGDIRLLKFLTGSEKLGLFTREYIELCNGEELKCKLYFKEKNKNIFLADAISEIQKKVLEEYEKKRKDNIYDDALKLMDKNEIDTVSLAINKFESIKGWKNSDDMIVKCNNRIVKLEKNKVYNDALLHFEKNTIQDLEIAIKIFNSIIDWRDSKKKIEECNIKIKKIKDENVYNDAMTLMNTGTIENLKAAIEKFGSVINFKDSKLKVCECEKGIKKCKEKVYQDSINKIKCNTIKKLEEAKDLLTSIIPYKDAERQIENIIGLIQELKEVEFIDTLEQERIFYCTKNDTPNRYKSVISEYGNNVLNMIIHNPYYILGLSCNAENTEALDVRDKIEKYARLKMPNKFNSSFDLKDIEKPNRSISSIQSAITELKNTDYKWLWFSGDEYCCWWESELLFELLRKSKKDVFDYDLMLACYINLLITDIGLSRVDDWKTVVACIDFMFNSPKATKIIEKHIGVTKITSEQRESFCKTIIQPMLLMSEKISEAQMKTLCLIINSSVKCVKLINMIGETIIKYITHKCYPLDEYMEQMSDSPKNYEVKKMIDLGKMVDTEIYSILPYIIEALGYESTCTKRIKKKYVETVWSYMVKLSDNNKKNMAEHYAKKLYEYCNDQQKENLRRVYGYKNMGATEDELEPSEMNSIAIECEENGDISTAIRWFKKAVEAGDDNAQSNLAFRYYEGKGVSKDIQKAISLWEKSAKQGNAVAQYELYLRYLEKWQESGNSIYSEDNLNTAIKWLKSACERNFEPALDIFKNIVKLSNSHDYNERRFGLKILRLMGINA